jgi:hypothetical protein
MQTAWAADRQAVKTVVAAAAAAARGLLAGGVQPFGCAVAVLQETDLETASRALEGKHLRSNKLVDLAPYLVVANTAAASAG